MAARITIRNVPERVRDELAARAARQGKSLQEFLRMELARLATRPSLDAVLDRIRKRKATSNTRVPATAILSDRNTDRR